MQTWCTHGNCGVSGYVQLSKDYSCVKENFDLVDGGKIANGIGVEVTYNVSQLKGGINFFSAATGAEFGMHVQPRRPVQFNVTDHPVDGKLPLSGGPSLDVAAIVKVRFDAKFDPGMKLE
ncbi:hypothetical protein [Luteibacter sp. 3190]|uniref:hypothetical protein n=1 Tax=Luteibacter sp. 3190 TaxID=2817736 RepID=UPI0028591C56|nr:hypothetical protein [Luteibacter sp. 3190]MDR6938271.1 hypothetical protein [Luteibacter sp. 3190]